MSPLASCGIILSTLIPFSAMAEEVPMRSKVFQFLPLIIAVAFLAALSVGSPGTELEFAL